MPVYSAHLGYQFTEFAPLDRFTAAADAGFVWIEHPSPYAIGVEAFAEHARAAGVRVAQIAAPSGDAALGEKGFACLPERGEAFLSSVREGLEAAHTIDAEFLHVMSGVVEGDPIEARSALRGTYVARITAAADLAAEAGAKLLIEPIDDGAVPGFFLNDPWFALEVLQEIARPNVFILFDVFHAHNRGIDPTRFWREAGEAIGHVHVADSPGRHEPGTGAIDFESFFKQIEASRYGGKIGCEYKPRDGTVVGLGWRDVYA